MRLPWRRRQFSGQSYGRSLTIAYESLESLRAEWRAMPWWKRAWIVTEQFFRYKGWQGWFDRGEE